MVKCDFSVYLIYLFDSQFCRIALAFSLVPLHQWKCKKKTYFNYFKTHGETICYPSYDFLKKLTSITVHATHELIYCF